MIGYRSANYHNVIEQVLVYSIKSSTPPAQHDVLGMQALLQGFGRRPQLLDGMLINVKVCWLTPPVAPFTNMV